MRFDGEIKGLTTVSKVKTTVKTSPQNCLVHRPGDPVLDLHLGMSVMSLQVKGVQVGV